MSDKPINIEVEIEGIKVYDPRDKTFKLSDNPALIIADLIIMAVIKHDVKGLEIDTNFWHIIGELADWVERPIIKPSFNSIYCSENCEYISKCQDYCSLYKSTLHGRTKSKMIRLKICIEQHGL